MHTVNFIYPLLPHPSTGATDADTEGTGWKSELTWSTNYRIRDIGFSILVLVMSCSFGKWLV